MEKVLERLWKNKLDHILLWIALLIYFFVNQKHLIEIGGTAYFLKETFIKIITLAFLTYANLSFLIPVFLKRKKYLLYSILILLIIAVYVSIHNYQDLYYYKTLLEVPGYNYFSSTLPNFSNAVLFICFGVALKLSKQFYLQQQQMQAVKVEKLDAELKYLKAQINPHSVFNSINSVFSLIDKRNTEARAALAKFSEILRYQLYECGQDKIGIDKELNYLSNFIQIQELRKGKNLVVDFNVSGNVKGFQIAPLLIAPFVENAFKYLSSYEEKENKIEIILDVFDNEFQMKVENTCDTISSETDLLQGGIGLTNVRRRLELMYPQKFDLKIEKTETHFSVLLNLQII